MKLFTLISIISMFFTFEKAKSSSIINGDQMISIYSWKGNFYRTDQKEKTFKIGNNKQLELLLKNKSIGVLLFIKDTKLSNDPHEIAVRSICDKLKIVMLERVAHSREGGPLFRVVNVSFKTNQKKPKRGRSYNLE
jgi:hypothetical protein